MRCHRYAKQDVYARRSSSPSHRNLYARNCALSRSLARPFGYSHEHLMDERIRSEDRRSRRAWPSPAHSKRSDDQVTLRDCRTANRLKLRARRKAASLLSIASLLILVFPSFVGSQSLDVVLRGRVSDDTGAGLPGATVTAIDEATAILRSAPADRDGYFVLLN